MRMEAQATSLPPPGPFDIATSSLLLDFDGTLVPIADSPDAVIVDAPLLALLGRLADRLDGRLAIISGRSIACLDALLGPVAAHMAMSGSHGCEHRWNGVSAQPERPPALDEIAVPIRLFADRHPGMLVEIKSFGVALHYRRAPDEGDTANALVRRLAQEAGLAYQPGDFVAEARVAGSDKGVAVARLMDHAPMAGTTPVFLGDDETDEAGLATVAAMDGIGIAVGPRVSRNARFHLSGPAAVRQWLENVA